MNPRVKLRAEKHNNTAASEYRKLFETAFQNAAVIRHEGDSGVKEALAFHYT